jgi:hypothetical protein
MELAQLVKNERVLRGKAFNHALYKAFKQQRRQHTNQIGIWKQRFRRQNQHMMTWTMMN